MFYLIIYIWMCCLGVSFYPLLWGRRVLAHGNYGLDTQSHIIGNILYLHHKIWCFVLRVVLNKNRTWVFITIRILLNRNIYFVSEILQMLFGSNISSQWLLKHELCNRNVRKENIFSVIVLEIIQLPIVFFPLSRYLI